MTVKRLVIFIFLMVVCSPLDAQRQTKLALVGGMLLDGYETPALHHAAILIEGDKIAQVGPASEVKIPPDAKIIDTSGQTMMPGLIELHAHLVILGHGNYNQWFAWLEQHKDKYPLERIMEISAKQLLQAGITSAVDLGSPLKESISIRDRINRGDVPGPRMSMSGPWIIPRNAIFPPMCQITVNNAVEAAQATEANIKGGVDLIKAQGGLTLEEYQAIAATAHKHNIKVHAHLYEEQAVRDALHAGIDVLQHVGSAGTPPYSADLIKEIVETGRPVVPTAAHRVWVYPATLDFPERLQDPRLKRDFPPDLYAEIQDSFKNFHALGYFQTNDRQEFFGDASVKQWITSGAVVGMGTDNGTPMNFHTDALWREAKVFVDHGMSPQRVISSLTRVNARILGKGNELGTIEPGKLADIIVVQGNPLFDISASLSNVNVVIKGGVVYKGGEAQIASAQTPATPSAPPASFTPIPADANSDFAHPQGTNLAIYRFTEHCANCHDTAKNGAPERYALTNYSPEQILASMVNGKMAPYAKGLSDIEMEVVAVYAGGRPLGSAEAGDVSHMMNRCVSKPLAHDPFQAGSWNGWGFDSSNSRFQPAAGISAEQVPTLKLKWAFGFPMGNSAYGQPTVVGGRVFVGADTGFVYSLDTASGCVHWSFRAKAGVRTAITIGRGNASTAPYLAYFGDIKGTVYAVNTETGAEVWSQRADRHPVARITGAPKLEEGRLYVPVASLEESGGGYSTYPCCTFRGSVVAYDAVTGKQIWKSYAIAEEARPLKKTSKGTQLWGPAGAGIWSTPAIDLKRRALYVGTGNAYTEPAADTSDAVMAFDLDTGKRLWSRQVMSRDAYVRDCRPPLGTPRSETCPDDAGPDMDFGSAPMLRTLPDGRELIVIGQKSGDAWALDPDKEGAVVWHRMVGKGLNNGGGGMQWGTASDNDLAYFPVTLREGDPIGMAALKLATGEMAWRAVPPVGSSSPATVIPGVIFSGASTGTLYAYSTTDGRIVWQYDTARAFPTVNGVEARGGTFNGSGPVVAGGMLFVPSGYSELGGGTRGNVLLAFGVE
jgi:polyvinyl alcohol dehydrogenase (cytochrome)